MPSKPIVSFYNLSNRKVHFKFKIFFSVIQLHLYFGILVESLANSAHTLIRVSRSAVSDLSPSFLLVLPGGTFGLLGVSRQYLPGHWFICRIHVIDYEKY